MKISNELRAALVTSAVMFATLFTASLVGFVGDLNEWASSSGGVDFPDPSALGKAAVSAALAAIGGLVNWFYRWIQSKGAVPGSGPVYPT